jgi:hypothetical protein
VFRIRNIFKYRTPPKLSLLTMALRRAPPMKKTTLAVAVPVLAVLMVLPVVRSVKLPAGKPVTIDRTMSADGWPMSSLLPKPSSMDAGTLVADGNPFPPFPPKSAVTLFADGNPFPPFPPKSAVTLFADGNPFPPFPPKAGQNLVSA